MQTTTLRKIISSACRKLVLAGSPVLLAISCAAGPEDEAGDAVASVAQAQATCGAGVPSCLSHADCYIDKCGTPTCKSGCCIYEPDGAEGTECEAADDNPGMCLWDPDRTIYSCCTGCMDENGACQPGTEADFCGPPRDRCQRCSDAVCKTGICTEFGKCDLEPQTGTSCTGGKCLNGGCCVGCISGSVCYVDDNAKCGSAGGSCTACGPCEECDGGTCKPKANGAPCDDGSNCTTDDQCNAGTCSGTPVVCNDNNACTDDSCDPATGCQNDPVPGDCNDGSACTTGDTCVGGECMGTPIACDDGNFCTDDSCDDALGCVYQSKPEDTACDDGNACSPTSACKDTDSDPTTARQCVATSGLDCNDNDPCTSDECEPNGPGPEDDACQDPRDPINEGGGCAASLCMTGQTCQAGVCQGGMPLDCADTSMCTQDDCDAATGCTHEPIEADCNDANPCTIDDACDNGECVGVEVECAPLDSCHQAGSCDPTTGTCSDPRKPDGASCGSSGRCDDGSCVVMAEGGAGGETGGPIGAGGDDSPGSAGSDTGASGSPAAADGGVFVRDPGGCACSLPGQRRGDGSLWALALAGLALAGRPRRARGSSLTGS